MLRRVKATIKESWLTLVISVALCTLLVLASRLYHPLVSLLLLVSLLTSLLSTRLYSEYEEKTRKLMLENLLITSRGLSSRSIATLRFTLQASTSALVVLAGFTAIYSALRGPQPLLAVPLFALMVLVAVVYFLPRLLVLYWASQRRVEVEAELPYLLILFRVLSSLKLPLYDVFTVVEKSYALQASAREVKFAKKISTVAPGSFSFLTAMDNVCANHPSEKVREWLRRVVAAAVAMGDVQGVVERVYDMAYSWFESKVASLTEKFTIILGSGLLVYLFAPVVVASIAPVMRVRLRAAVILVLCFQVILLYVLYALIKHSYPSSLVVKPSKRLVVSGALAYSIVVFLLALSMFTYMGVRGPLLGDNALLAVSLLAFSVPLVLSELELKRVDVYDDFVRTASDALSLAAVTGENAAQVVMRYSAKRGGKVAKLARSVVTGYASEPLRKAIVSRAPTVHHASFVETLMVIFSLGSTPDMLKAFTASYERLNVPLFSARNLVKRVEWLVVGLVALVGGFTAYLNRVFEYIASVAARTQVPGQVVFFVYEPVVYGLLSVVTLLSIVFMALLLGTVRGGSTYYGFRAAVSMMLAYTVAKYLLMALLPS